jgi:hypothetical protein
LVPIPLGITTRFLFCFVFQLNSCGHITYVPFSPMRGWVCLLWTALPFVKCTYHTYSMLSKILPYTLHTSPLSVQAFQSRSCYLIYLLLQRQLRHLNSCKLDRRIV